MKKLLYSTLVLILLSSFFLSCESGGSESASSGSGTGDDNTPSEPESPAVLSPGDVAVFFRVYLGSSSSFFNQYAITIEQDSYAIIRYVPASGEMAIIEKFSSVSYASRYDEPYTQSGKLFIVDHYRGDEDSFDIWQYDSKTGLPLERVYNDWISVSSYCIIDQKVFFQESRLWDSLKGDYGGHYYAGEFDSWNRTKLLDYYSSELYFGTFHEVNGQLYTVADMYEWPNFRIDRRNKSNGLIEANIATVTEDTSYHYYGCEMSDHGMFYIRQHKTTGVVELFKRSWTGGAFTLRQSFSPGDVYTFAAIDVDAEMVLIHLYSNDGGMFYVYNDQTMESNSYTFNDIRPNSFQILKVR